MKEKIYKNLIEWFDAQGDYFAGEGPNFSIEGQYDFEQLAEFIAAVVDK